MDINNIINNCNFCSVKMMSLAISDDKKFLTIVVKEV